MTKLLKAICTIGLLWFTPVHAQNLAQPGGSSSASANCLVSGASSGYLYNNTSNGCNTSTTLTTNGSLDTESGLLAFTGITTPTTVAGSLLAGGIVGSPTFGANGEGAIYLSTVNGIILQGQGSTNDITLLNKNGVSVCRIITGTGQWLCTGAITGGSFIATGSAIPTNGVYLPLTNTIGIATNSIETQGWNTAGTSMFVPVFMANLPNAGSSSAMCFTPGTSAVTFNSGVTTCLVSTASVKDIKRPLTKKEGLDIVLAMTPDIYEYKKDFTGGARGEQIGFVGEDVAKVDNRFVARDEKGNVSGVRYEQYTAALTAAIQAQQACLDSWKCRIFGWK